jgi:hypothetical protein
LLFCSAVAKHTLPDIPKELEVACYTALPVACVQTESIDVLKGVYEFDLLRYVSWYGQWAGHLRPHNVEDAVTFFRWMELKVRFEVNAQITSDS